MAQDRKKIIVNEINYWKESKLLPEKYCNFLLALYTEGEGEVSQGLSLFQGKTWMVTYYLLNFLMLPLSFVVIYFTENDIILQTVVLSVFVLLSGLQLWWIHHQKGLIHIPLCVTLLLIFLMSMTLGAHFLTNPFVFILALMNTILWYGTGWWFQLTYMKTISVLLLGGIVIYMLL